MKLVLKNLAIRAAYGGGGLFMGVVGLDLLRDKENGAAVFCAIISILCLIAALSKRPNQL